MKRLAFLQDPFLEIQPTVKESSPLQGFRSEASPASNPCSTIGAISGSPTIQIRAIGFPGSPPWRDHIEGIVETKGPKRARTPSARTGGPSGHAAR